MNIDLQEIRFGSKAYQDSLTLRAQVLRQPLGITLSDDDIRYDQEQIHLAAFSNGVLCGCLVLAPQDGEVVKMRQVAVDPQVQGHGIGRRLVEFAEAEAKRRLFSRIVLNARETALDFYLKLGYEDLGKPQQEVRIPHRQMQKILVVPWPQRVLPVAGHFLRLGATAFGGPAAHISIMEDEFVRRRKWITKTEFLDLMALSNLIPGPNSTEMVIHIGFKKAGWRGLVLGGAAFILPAFLMVWAIAIFYGAYGQLPAVQSVLLGVKPVIIAVIAQALLNLSRSALKSRFLFVIFTVALVSYFVSEKEIFILLFAGLASYLWNSKFTNPHVLKGFVAAVTGYVGIFGSRAWAAVLTSSIAPLEGIFIVFLKIGSVLFGSGYVLVAFLQSELIEKHHWLTQQQLFDALAVGQFTPGPVFTTATFIGYLMGGNEGAFVATLGIFLPAFFFVGLTVLFMSHLKRSQGLRFFLDGLSVASLALMAGVECSLVYQNRTSSYTLLAALIALILLVRFRMSSMQLMVIGGLLGLFLF